MWLEGVSRWLRIFLVIQEIDHKRRLEAAVAQNSRGTLGDIIKEKMRVMEAQLMGIWASSLLLYLVPSVSK